MYSSNQLGVIGEYTAKLYFASKNFEIYDSSNNNYFDFIVRHPKTLEFKSVEVKARKPFFSLNNKKEGQWVFDLDLRKSKNSKEIKEFDNSDLDIIAFVPFVGNSPSLFLIDAKKVTVKRGLTISYDHLEDRSFFKRRDLEFKI